MVSMASSKSPSPNLRRVKSVKSTFDSRPYPRAIQYHHHNGGCNHDHNGCSYDNHGNAYNYNDEETYHYHYNYQETYNYNNDDDDDQASNWWAQSFG